MRRIWIVILTIIGTLGATLQAETVSRKQALDYAQRFFNLAHHSAMAPPKQVYDGRRLTTNRLFAPFYVFNHPAGGFVIISAENKALPILGYSLKDTFNPDGLGAAEEALLRNYAIDIEQIRYDSRVPIEAIEAWRDYDGYVERMLNAEYQATDPTITPEEAAETLDMLWSTDAGLDSYADLYTPEQWSEMVDVELAKRGSAAIGYIDGKGLHPAIIYGRQGDMYRIRLDNPNTWLMRLNATEFLCDRQLLSTLSPTYIAPAVAEEIPFAFYDEFVRSVTEENEKAEALRLDPLQGEPLIKAIGAGHFEVVLPEDARLAMLYNLAGNHIGRRTYKNTNVAAINIEAEPNGFYFAIIYGESGRPYGVKLYR